MQMTLADTHVQAEMNAYLHERALVAHNYCYLGRNCGRMHFQRVYVATSSFAIE